MLSAEKSKASIMETLETKESSLEKINQDIIVERKQWNEYLSQQRSNLQMEINQHRNEAKERTRKMQDDATTAMNRLSKQLSSKFERASTELNEKARQVELLHGQLSTIARQTKRDKANIEEKDKSRQHLLDEIEKFKNLLEEKHDDIILLTKAEQSSREELENAKNKIRKLEFDSSEKLEILLREKAALLNEVQEYKHQEAEINARLASIKQKEDKVKEKDEERIHELRQFECSLKEQDARLSCLREEIESNQDQLRISNEQIIVKETSLAETEDKLKEYAQMLKRQGREIKQKEKDIKNAAKLLSHEKSKKDKNDYKLILDLKQLVEDGRVQYKELLAVHKKLEETLSEKDEIINDMKESTQKNSAGSDFTEAQQALHQLALQLKEKDERLEEKLAKCHECEAQLASWQKQLENFAFQLSQEQES